MPDREWPVATPRDEMLSRVAARGTRIRFLRRAAQGAMIASVLAVASAGGVAVVSSLGGDGAPGDETQLAVQAETPVVETSSSTTEVSTVDEADGAIPVTAVDPVDDELAGAIGDASSGETPQPGPVTTEPSAPPAASTPDRPSGSTTSTSTAPAPVDDGTGETPEPTPPTPDEPSMGQLRMRTTGVPTGSSMCLGEPDSEATIPVQEAERVVVSWDDEGIRHSVMAVNDGYEWRASLSALAARPQLGETVTVTVTATGPGGRIDTAHDVDVVDCS